MIQETLQAMAEKFALCVFKNLEAGASRAAWL